MIKTYKLKLGIWLYPGKAAWHLVTLPVDVAKEINFYFSMEKRGWGSLPVLVTAKNISWKTSIFPDKKTNSFVLPIKKEVRLKEGVKARDEIELEIKLGSI